MSSPTEIKFIVRVTQADDHNCIKGKHRDLQRVTVPYAQLLGVLSGSGDEAVDDASNAGGSEAMVS